MEALWLAAVALVPLSFGGPAFMVFVDGPKVLLLRVLTGLMVSLWALEVALGLRPPPSLGRDVAARLGRWARQEPVRWAVVFALLFLAVATVSALLSPRPGLSIWGVNPGRDGGGLYNLASYTVLFLVVSTRLKRADQLLRLLWAVAGAGALAGLYAVLQHFGLDPLGTGPVERATSTFGNALFAGSYLSVSLVATAGLTALMMRRRPGPGTAALMGALMTAQGAGLAFTLSRGPWVAALVGLATWGAVAWWAFPRREAGPRRAVLRAASATALALTVAVGLALMPAPRQGTAMASAPSGPLGDEGPALVRRAASIVPEATTGGLTGRLSIWRRSLRLVAERPWLEPEAPPVRAARYLVGYGPDLFLYALPLRPAADAKEPVNASAHNQPLQVAVEEGALGLAIWLSFLAALYLGGLSFLWKGRGRTSADYRLAGVAVLAALVARGVEQMTGVARVSDTVLFWALAGALVALPQAAGRAHPTEASDKAAPSSDAARRRAMVPRWAWGLLAAAALALVVWKDATYDAASLVASAGVQAARSGDLPTGMERLEQASRLAPDVEFYYTARAQLMARFAPSDDADRVEMALERLRLYLAALDRNPLSHTARARAAATALEVARLGRPEMASAAVELFRELVVTLPGYGPAYTGLAAAYLLDGRPEASLETLEALDRLEGVDQGTREEALYLRGLAYADLGHTEEGARALREYLRRSPRGPYADAVRRTLEDMGIAP